MRWRCVDAGATYPDNRYEAVTAGHVFGILFNPCAGTGRPWHLHVLPRDADGTPRKGSGRWFATLGQATAAAEKGTP